MNENFTKELVGFDKRMSHALLDNLFRTIAEAYEYQVRWKWTKNAVAIWDNRAVFHTGIYDYGKNGLKLLLLIAATNIKTVGGHLRHGLRVASQAETPYFDSSSRLRNEDLRN